MKLPRYVVQIKRANGRLDHVFTIPARQRPEGWPATIRLPKDNALRTRDGSAQEIAAVIRDGLEINRALDAERAEAPSHPRGSLAWLMDEWRASDEWKRLTPKTQRFYNQGWAHIEKRSGRKESPHIARVSWPAQVKLLESYKSRRAVHRQIRNVLQRLCQIAFDKGFIQANPWVGQERRKWATAPSQYEIEIWTYEHVQRAVALCDALERPEIGTAILIGFDLMQYPAQIAMFRRGEHYDAKTSEFIYNRNKTGIPARVKVSETLRERLVGTEIHLITRKQGSVQVPVSGEYLSKQFRKIMKRAIGPNTGLWTFEMRWLRHSGVFEARRAGLDLETIADIGAWKSTGAVQQVIDKHYRVPDGMLASVGQAKREAYRSVKVVS